MRCGNLFLARKRQTKRGMLHKERGGRQKWNNNAFDSIYQKDYCESLLLVEEKVVDLFFTNPCVFC